ncbi:hypothetical protein BDR04DRAFT_1101073 [Suillus decipiens]|nr:hypothetical protein BDR04DRAFT_1101073 [Suillus decipiens]
MCSRWSPSSFPFLNLSRSWPSQNKTIALPHPKHYYATTSPNHDDKLIIRCISLK